MLLPTKNNILDHLLDKHLQLEEKLLNLFQEKDVKQEDLFHLLEDIRKNNEITRKKLRLREKEFSLQTDFSLIKEKELDLNLLESYQVAKDHISSIQKVLKRDEIPTFNLSKIVKFLNLFEETLVKNTDFISEEEIDNKLINVSTQCDEIPLSFKSGKKLILNLSNFDLSLFSYDELIEILRILDIIITDDRYDYLRTEISKQIVKLNSNS